MVYTRRSTRKEGGTYGVNCFGDLQKYPKEQLLLQIVFQTDPAKKDKLAGIVVDELKKLSSRRTVRRTLAESKRVHAEEVCRQPERKRILDE